MPGRSSKQCRARYNNHLDPNVRKDPWTNEEDEVIISLIPQVGFSWTQIAKSLPGRTDAAIANRFHQSLKRRFVIRQTPSATGPGGAEITLTPIDRHRPPQVDEPTPWSLGDESYDMDVESDESSPRLPTDQFYRRPSLGIETTLPSEIANLCLTGFVIPEPSPEVKRRRSSVDPSGMEIFSFTSSPQTPLGRERSFGRSTNVRDERSTFMPPQSGRRSSMDGSLGFGTSAHLPTQLMSPRNTMRRPSLGVPVLPGSMSSYTSPQADGLGQQRASESPRMLDVPRSGLLQPVDLLQTYRRHSADGRQQRTLEPVSVADPADRYERTPGWSLSAAGSPRDSPAASPRSAADSSTALPSIEQMLTRM